MILRSPHYDDIYFSVQDGRAEKQHVFLNGNQLPVRWRDRSDFVVCEAGFGTGLNFLLTLQLFRATTSNSQRLHFIACEKHPLIADQIRGALDMWRDRMGPDIDALLSHYHMIIPGVHRFVFDHRVFLTLLIGDLNDLLPQVDAAVDAWYLDGFNPAKNPAMWSPTLFDAMKNLSARGATAATYSAARVVKDHLARAGFTVTKQAGYGHKTDMLTARFETGGRPPLVTPRAQKIVVQGAGLAGTSLARILKQQGHNVDVIAPHGVADAASGNLRGLYNPRLTGTFTPLALGYASGFAALYRHACTLRADLEFLPCGALHLIRDDHLRARFTGMVQTWGWGDGAQILTAAQAGERAGIPLGQDALWLPYSGALSPAQLCYANLGRLAGPTGIQADGTITLLKTCADPADYDVTVLACGIAVKNNPQAAYLPLRTVRGQISVMAANAGTQKLQANLCYGGYLCAPVKGHHVLGATFHHGLMDTEVHEEDHRDVIDRLTAQVGPLFNLSDVRAGRAGLRVTTPDRAPVIGCLPHSRTYVSTAHGSHGLVTTMLSAQIVADQISGFPQVYPQSLRDVIDPARFLRQTKG